MDWDAYLILKTLGMAVFIFAGGRDAAKNLRISPSKAYLINLVAVSVGFAASRLWYILQHLYGAEPYVWQGFQAAWENAGSVLYGFVLGGTLAIFILTRLFKISTVRYLDCVAPWMLVAQFLNRLGCFDAGCCYGKLTDCPISVENTEAGGRVHPVQLYEAFYDLGLFWFIRTRPKRVGLPAFLYYTGYAVGRFFFEFLRGDNLPAFLFMTVPQVTSVLILAAVFSFKKKILGPPNP